MRICAFSDIHGNGPAFRVAKKKILKEAADLNIFLGDLCGYYFDQEEIFAELLNLPNLIALRGNHDQMFLEIFRGNEKLRKDYLEKYGRSIEYLLEKDCNEIADWLAQLPGSSIQLTKGLTAAHGSPWDPVDGYVYPDTALDLFLEESSNLFLMGHTHYPMKKLIGEKLIVNPGSIGQPRNGGLPSYAVINDASGKVKFQDVPYNCGNILRQIEQIDHNNKYLKDVILRYA